jgi:glycosyltransferase involved in cell wall biosynthesis
MTTVSVALCTFNGQRFLGEQLSSLAAQSRLPDELVIRDDQSKDLTLQVVREFARKAPFQVRIVDSDAHLGVAAAFSALSTFCTSDVIFYCDQDDVWDRRKIEKSVGVLNDGQWWAVASDAELVNERLDSLGGTFWSNSWLGKQPAVGEALFSRLLLQGNIVAGMSLAVRREFALAHLPPPSPWLHDG